MIRSPSRGGRRLGGLAALLLCSACILPTAALAGQTVALRAQPVSHGGTVTLGDLFDGAQGAAAKIVVGHVPPAGQQSVLQASTIQQIAAAAGLDWNNAQGLHHIIVESGPAEPVRQAEAETAPAVASHSHTHLASRRRAQTLVYARNIMSGEILTAADLEWSDDAVAAADSPGEPELIEGKMARRPLRAGACAEMHDLDSPKVVHRNDLIDVAYEADGIRVVLEGKAMGDAAVGDSVEVMNPQSKKVIEAVASAPGQAVVGPQADRLKAAAYIPAISTASLR